MPDSGEKHNLRDLSLIEGLELDAGLLWKNLTTLGVGKGIIPILAHPLNDIALVKLITYCGSNKLPFMILGNGSNMVGRDSGYNGIIIKLDRGNFVKIAHGRRHIIAGAGAMLRDFVSFSADSGFGGYASLAPIPGTIGGALRMNAGAGGVDISCCLSEICGIDSKGNTWSAEKNDLLWGHRSSSIPDDIIITAAIFKLPKASPAKESTKMKEAFDARKNHEPSGRSCGCVFKNINADAPSGKLIDISGCKGLSIGGLQVSPRHANYFVNECGASEEDFVTLASKVREEVFNKTGIYLEPEVCFADRDSLRKVIARPRRFRVAVLKGGGSREREVSLESGSAVAGALRVAGWIVDEVDIKQPIITDEMRVADIVFPVLHGGFGENGEIQKLMEDAGIPFAGCGSHSSSIVIDKIKSKHLMEAAGIKTAPYAVITKENTSLPQTLSMPLVLKPPREGSTVGITRVSSLKEWEEVLKKAFEYDDEILAEHFVEGIEITAGVVDGRALPLIEIQYPGLMYDYDAKYTHANGETFYICPPDSLSVELREKAKETALEFYHVVRARDLLRIDMIVDSKGDIFVLEANSIPGFTASSLVPKAATVAGISFTELCAGIAVRGLSRSLKNELN